MQTQLLISGNDYPRSPGGTGEGGWEPGRFIRTSTREVLLKTALRRILQNSSRSRMLLPKVYCNYLSFVGDEGTKEESVRLSSLKQ